MRNLSNAKALLHTGELYHQAIIFFDEEYHMTLLIHADWLNTLIVHKFSGQQKEYLEFAKI